MVSQLTNLLFVLFVVFLVRSKRYTLRERNREINIQAIVEEHYERYIDQEEEYIKNQQYVNNNRNILLKVSTVIVCARSRCYGDISFMCSPTAS